MKTAVGVFIQDPSGLWHYRHLGAAGHVNSAVADAIEHRIGPAWFWFNDTPAPIFLSDTVESLVKRWSEWRSSHQKGSLLDQLIALPPR